MLFVIARLKQNKFVRSLLTREAAEQFERYVISGLISACVEYTMLLVLTEFAGIWYILSNTIAYVSGFWLSFLLNRFWSFKSKDNILRQLLLYSMLFICNLVLTNMLLYLLTSVTGIPYAISKIFVMGIAVLWNFIIYKKIIYRK
ncbi:MAG TPA: GtrA family protein [Clostridiaceae bacterium]|nr:GtrA family protein [Clostridiaceae bacterium]